MLQAINQIFKKLRNINRIFISYETPGRARELHSYTVNILSSSIAIITLIATIVFYHLTHDRNAIRYGCVGVGLMVTTVILNFRHFYELSNMIFFLSVNFIAFQITDYFEGLKVMELVYVFLILLLFWLFHNKILRLICFIGMLVRIALFEFSLQDTSAAIATYLILFLIMLVFIFNIVWQFRLEHINMKKNDFFKHMSHDVEGSFYSLDSIIETIELEKDFDEGLMDDLSAASRYHKFILDTFTDHSRFLNADLHSLHYESFDVKTHIEKVVKLISYFANKAGVSISVDPGTQQPIILKTDKAKISRILDNLLSNAIKHTPKGNHICIELAIEDKYWSFAVTNRTNEMNDTFGEGVLIPLEETSDTQTTRLGLRIVNNLVNSLNGRAFSFRKGLEICFKVMIPLL